MTHFCKEIVYNLGVQNKEFAVPVKNHAPFQQKMFNNYRNASNLKQLHEVSI